MIYKPLPASFDRKRCFETPLSHLKPLKVRQPNLRGCHCVVFQNRYWIYQVISGIFTTLARVKWLVALIPKEKFLKVIEGSIFINIYD